MRIEGRELRRGLAGAHLSSSSIRRKLGDDAEDPKYILTEFRVGYRMPKRESEGQLEE